MDNETVARRVQGQSSGMIAGGLSNTVAEDTLPIVSANRAIAAYRADILHCTDRLRQHIDSILGPVPTPTTSDPSPPGRPDSEYPLVAQLERLGAAVDQFRDQVRRIT